MRGTKATHISLLIYPKHVWTCGLLVIVSSLPASLPKLSWKDPQKCSMVGATSVPSMPLSLNTKGKMWLI